MSKQLKICFFTKRDDDIFKDKTFVLSEYRNNYVA
jgi:hypothetical protein